jgi:hypothetical protein
MEDKLKSMSEYILKNLTTHINDIFNNKLYRIQLDVGFRGGTLFNEKIYDDNIIKGKNSSSNSQLDMKEGYTSRIEITNRVFTNISDYIRWSMLYSDKKHISGKILTVDTLDNIRRYPYCYKGLNEKNEISYFIIQNNEYSSESVQKDKPLSLIYSYYVCKQFETMQHNTGFLSMDVLDETTVKEYWEELEKTGYIEYKYNSVENKIEMDELINEETNIKPKYSVVKYENNQYGAILPIKLYN